MVVAVGPFTLSEDLDYAPLAALLAVCRQRRPDVLVLLGPFVDAEHPLLAQGTVDLTFEDIFDSQVGVQFFFQHLPGIPVCHQTAVLLARRCCSLS